MKVLTKREREIILYLVESKKYQTSKTLSILLYVSGKTIRNDIKKINRIIYDYGAVISSTKTKGYFIEVYDTQKFETFKVKIISTASNTVTNELIERLLINSYLDNKIYQQDMADDLYVSETTLKKILLEAKDKLKSLNINIKSNNVEGIRLIAKEENLRSGIYQYIFSHSHLINKYYDIFNIDEVNFEINISDEVNREFSEKNIKLTYDAITGISNLIIIAISRAKYKFNVSYSNSETEELNNSNEYSAVNDLFNKLVAKLPKFMSVESEILYITKQSIISARLNSNIINDNFDVSKIVDKVIENIKKRTSIDFSDDMELNQGLITHLGVAFNRIKFKSIIKNDFLETIKRDYPLAFELAVILSEEIFELINIKINENEIGYIAVHFGLALERKRINHKRDEKRILVVCSSNVATAILIKKTLLKSLNNHLIKIETIDTQNFKKISYYNFDLILTTIPLEIPTQKMEPIIKRIKPVISSQDLQEIKEILNNKKTDNGKIQNFFTRKLFFKGLKIKSKKEVLEYVTRKMESYSYIDKKTKKAIFEREGVSTTEIGRLIAIPHPLNNNMDTPVVAVCTLEKPILWTEQMVQVILILSIPHKDIKVWETVFRRLYEFLYEDFGVSKLITEYDFDDFIESLK